MCYLSYLKKGDDMEFNIIKDGYKFLIDVVFINLLWLFVSALGLFITFGAATTAMFSVSYKLIDIKSEPYVAKTYFKSFKENFIRSTIVWFIILIIGIPLYLIYNYAVNQELTVLIVSVIFTAFELLIFSLYVFPIIAKFETKSIFQLMKNTFLIANIHGFTTFKILGSLAFVLLLVLKVHSFFILIAVGIYSVFVSFHLMKIFKIYINKIENNED